MQSKDVTVNGKKYHIEQMTPFVAGRVYGWLKGAAIEFSRRDKGQTSAPDRNQTPSPEEQQEIADGSVEYTWSIAPSTISEEACEKIQRYALQVCRYYDAPTNAPCDLLVNGRIADAALQENGPGVDDLVLKSLQLSCSPFFLRELLKMFPATPTA
jgi:hypothetical protein